MELNFKTARCLSSYDDWVNLWAKKAMELGLLSLEHLLLNRYDQNIFLDKVVMDSGRK
jgi:hypothetical protein